MRAIIASKLAEFIFSSSVVLHDKLRMERIGIRTIG